MRQVSPHWRRLRHHLPLSAAMLVLNGRVYGAVGHADGILLLFVDDIDFRKVDVVILGCQLLERRWRANCVFYHVFLDVEAHTAPLIDLPYQIIPRRIHPAAILVLVFCHETGRGVSRYGTVDLFVVNTSHIFLHFNVFA